MPKPIKHEPNKPALNFEPEVIKEAGFRADGKPEPSFLAILSVIVGVVALATIIVLLLTGE